MFFNSLPFLFGFLPIAVAVFFVLGARSRNLAALWLVAASFFFYGWWNVSFVGLLFGSAIFNYAAAYLISLERNGDRLYRARLLLIVAVAADLFLLGYYKYAGFIAQVISDTSRISLNFGNTFLPLGISFFTFTQIAFLSDEYHGKVRERNFSHYLLFVTYFPHLIAGPILHHTQMMPQFADRKTYRINWSNVASGLTMFIVGLTKKVMLADSFSKTATPVFVVAQNGLHPPLVEAWVGALGYTLQLYFDFSGYSDMAIGISLLFNVKLPLNFNSPYKAQNIIEFWRRWHMTLSNFLRDYLYIPLGGNRKGIPRRYLNLMITMLLGGLWHGAGWTYIVWGGLHGVYLAINHGFRAVCSYAGYRPHRLGRFGARLSVLVTFVFVVVAWVFFRADSFAAASTILQGMAGRFGLRGISWLPTTEMDSRATAALLLIGLTIIWLLPNSQEMLRRFDPVWDHVDPPAGWAAKIVWRPARWAAPILGLALALCILMMSPNRISEFVYYQF